MKLREKQSLFALHVGELLVTIPILGEQRRQMWEVTLGDAARTDGQGHMDGSLHYIRLAIDINLFVGGRYIRSGSHPAWPVIGEFWESLHELAAWGGRFGDANHFSFSHRGRR